MKNLGVFLKTEPVRGTKAGLGLVPEENEDMKEKKSLDGLGISNDESENKVNVNYK